MFHNGERGFIDFRADQRRPPGPQRNDAFSRESESPAKPEVPSSLSEAMKRAEMMVARIETRYERSRSQARRDRRSRSRSRSRARSPAHRGGSYRARDKSRGRSRSRRRSPRGRTPIDNRSEHPRHRSKSSGRHGRSDSLGRHMAERGRSPGPYRRNGRVSRFDQPDEHRPRSRSRSGRSPTRRRTPPRMSPFKEGRSPLEPNPRDAFPPGALSRFKAPLSPKRDSLSPTPLIGEPNKASNKRADPKSQSAPGRCFKEHLLALLTAVTVEGEDFLNVTGVDLPAVRITRRQLFSVVKAADPKQSIVRELYFNLSGDFVMAYSLCFWLIVLLHLYGYH